MTDGRTIAALLPDYDIGDEVGRGAYGAVFKGHHRDLGRDVAIKALSPALAEDPDIRRRFTSEAQVLASLRHPHIVPVYEYVERDGHCLLVMELLPGGTVWHRFRQGGFSPETGCAVVMAACAGLQYAHQHGVLHRDLKPENLLLSAGGALKITDLGMAKVIGAGETLATRAGEILGTPAYLSPEQAGGSEPTAAVDLYAAGVILFELLSGHLPYSDEGGALDIVLRHLYEDPYDLDALAPELPEPLVEVTMQAIAPFVEDRYPTAEALGVAVGEAAATAWGTDWLSRAEVGILDAGPIAEAARRPSPENAPARETPARRFRRAPAPTPPPPSPEEPPTPDGAEARRVHPVAEAHATGLPPADPAGAAELVPVREVIDLPSPLASALVAVVLLVLAVAVGFRGLGAPVPERALPPGVVTVGGTDVARPGVVTLDLARPVELTVGALPDALDRAEAVQLGFSVGGLPLPASGIASLDVADGVKSLVVEASSARFLAAGRVTGEVRLLGEDEVVARSPFLLEPHGSPLSTIPGGVTILLLLVLLAYAATLLRPLWRGRNRASALGGMTVVGAGLGVALVPLGWMTGAPEPRGRTLLVCAALGAGWGLAAAIATRRAGRRRRLEPRPATGNGGETG